MLLSKRRNAINHHFSIKSSRIYLRAGVSCSEPLIRARLGRSFYGMKVKAKASYISLNSKKQGLSLTAREAVGVLRTTQKGDSGVRWESSYKNDSRLE